jgi:hypothetical protein
MGSQATKPGQPARELDWRIPLTLVTILWATLRLVRLGQGADQKRQGRPLVTEPGRARASRSPLCAKRLTGLQWLARQAGPATGYT